MSDPSNIPSTVHDWGWIGNVISVVFGALAAAFAWLLKRSIKAETTDKFENAKKDTEVMFESMKKDHAQLSEKTGRLEQRMAEQERIGTIHNEKLAHTEKQIDKLVENTDKILTMLYEFRSQSK